MLISERLDALDAAIAEERIINGDWRDTTRSADEGKEYVCLLVALFPEVHSAPEQCPSDWIPQWVAVLIPIIDDMVTTSAWAKMIHRFAVEIRKTVDFQSRQWDLVRCRMFASMLKHIAPKDDENSLYLYQKFLKDLEREDFKRIAAWSLNRFSGREGYDAIVQTAALCVTGVSRVLPPDKLLPAITGRYVRAYTNYTQSSQLYGYDIIADSFLDAIASVSAQPPAPGTPQCETVS